MAPSCRFNRFQHKTLCPEGPFCLVSPFSLSIGRKGAPALPSKDDLVLYHPLLVCRDQQNQPQQRLRGEDLVLYHLRSRGPQGGLSSFPPLLDVRISTLKIPGVLLDPFSLGLLLPGFLTPLPKTGLLPFPYPIIGNEKTTTKNTPRDQ